MADIVNGLAVLHAPQLDAIFRRIARRLFELGEKGWSPRRDIDPIVIWSPREYNTVADHMVNAAMDNNCAWQKWDRQLLEDHIKRGGSLRICVDGGLRRGTDSLDKPSALGCAIYLVRKVQPQYTLAGLQAAPVKSVGSAFQAEAMALEWAINLINVLM